MFVDLFPAFAAKVNANWLEMQKYELFVADVDTDELWQTYLNAFPPGTNPMFRERTEHDCSCCRHFIKNIGRVVALEGAVRTVWDGLNNEREAIAFYGDVAQKMNTLVQSKPILQLFRTKEGGYGHEFNFEAGPPTIKWHHFHGSIAEKHRSDSPGEDIGKYAARVQVFRRGVTELKSEAVGDILDLIASNSLYRGEEHRAAVEGFMRIQADWGGTGAKIISGVTPQTLPPSSATP